MSRFSIPILFCTFLSLFAENLSSPPENIEFGQVAKFNPVEDENSHLPPESYASYSQLNIWAKFQFYRLSPDSPEGGIQDGICRMVPKEGFRFFLKIPRETGSLAKQNYRLILDITRFSPTPQAKPSPRALEIYTNGEKRIRIGFPSPKSQIFPVEIPLEPKDIENGIVEVLLVPGAAEIGRFWGIWDAWLEKI